MVIKNARKNNFYLIVQHYIKRDQEDLVLEEYPHLVKFLKKEEKE